MSSGFASSPLHQFPLCELIDTQALSGWQKLWLLGPFRGAVYSVCDGVGVGRRDLVYEVGSDLGVLESRGAPSWGQPYCPLPVTLMASLPAVEGSRGLRPGFRGPEGQSRLELSLEPSETGWEEVWCHRAYCVLGTSQPISSHPPVTSTMPGGGPAPPAPLQQAQGGVHPPTQWGGVSANGVNGSLRGP